MTSAANPAAEGDDSREATLLIWLQLFRPHILSIVYFSTLTYGFIFSERYDLLLPLVAVWDWFFVNFTNKATDVAEDLQNHIPGAQAMSNHRRAVEWANAALITLGLLAGLFIYPEILPFRFLFTVIGLAYNYRIVPTLRRQNRRGLALARTRLKEMYFFKNFGSSMLFTLSVFVYPLFAFGVAETYPWPRLALAVLFFIPLELTYEILYDLRDLDGDRAQGVPTYPVVHGRKRALQLVYGLIALSAVAPLIGALTGLLRLREWIVVMGCVQQAIVIGWFTRRGRQPSQRDTEVATYLGAAQLLSYNLWVVGGLPLGE